MNEHKDRDAELVAELAGLRPVPPSAGLRQRIADSLPDVAPHADLASPRRSRGPLWLAALCGPIAAVLTFFLVAGPQKPARFGEQPEFRTEAATAAAFDDHLPSVWSYRRSINQSPAELDALLDKHAHDSLTQKPQRAGAFVFARSDSQLEDFLGEL